VFKNRIQAGDVLAEELSHIDLDNALLLAVPRGGVVVAVPAARRLGLPIGVLITRKLGHPLNPEVAIGAVMPDGSAMYDAQTMARLGLGDDDLNKLIEQEYLEIKRRLAVYTGSEDAPAISNRTVLLIDDGIATGYTLYAAVKWLKTLTPQKIIIAVPVAPPEVISSLAAQVDMVICPLQPPDFTSVGMHYQDFSQTTDAEVIHILNDLKQEK